MSFVNLIPGDSFMGELIALGACIALMHELLRLVLDRMAWNVRFFPKVRAKVIIIRFFTILTFPIVLFTYLVAAIWLLPYLLLSKPYRAHLKQEASEHNNMDWNGDGLSGQLSSLAVPAFLTLPFKPIFAFMEFLGRRKSSPWRSTSGLQPVPQETNLR